MPVGDPVTDYDGLRQHDIALKTWIDDNLVHKAGTEAETIGGVKTFSSQIAGSISGSSGSVRSSAIKTNGGLALEDGKLVVDFSQMPTEQMEDLLDSMNLPVYIDGANVSTEFYVATTGDDSTGDGSQAHPWATIAHAATEIANHYNINTQTVHINVGTGTYTDQIVLGAFSATTGKIVIRPASASDTVVIQRTISKDDIGVLCSGGSWDIEDIALEATLGAQPADSRNHSVHLLQTNGNGAKLGVTRCPMTFVDNSLPSGSGYGTAGIYMLSCFNGATVTLTGGSSAVPVELSGSAVNASVYWLRASGGAILQPNCAGGPYYFNVSGSFTQFLSVANATYQPTATSNIPVWNAVDSPTGRRYNVNDGGRVVTRLASASDVATYFPGDTNGAVNAATYSFISPTA